MAFIYEDGDKKAFIDIELLHNPKNNKWDIMKIEVYDVPFTDYWNATKGTYTPVVKLCLKAPDVLSLAKTLLSEHTSMIRRRA
jgi:hypothetical protein